MNSNSNTHSLEQSKSLESISPEVSHYLNEIVLTVEEMSLAIKKEGGDAITTINEVLPLLRSNIDKLEQNLLQDQRVENSD